MELSRAMILLAAGAGAGLMNAVAGGGTILTFPTLMLAGVSSIHANATSTVALLPGTLAGVAGYRRNIPNVYQWIKLFALVSLVGGFLGGILLTATSPRLFDQLVPFLILFATILFTAQGFFARRLNFEINSIREGKNWTLVAVFFQFAVAVYGGYFGAGIGILMLASLGLLGFQDVHEMNTVKGVLGFLINVVAALYFIVAGLIDWPAAALVACGSMAGGYGGAYFAQKISQATVRHLITAIGFSITALMFYKQLGSK